MNKFISFILSFVLLLILGACSNDEFGNTDNPKPEVIKDSQHFFYNNGTIYLSPDAYSDVTLAEYASDAKNLKISASDSPEYPITLKSDGTQKGGLTIYRIVASIPAIQNESDDNGSDMVELNYTMEADVIEGGKEVHRTTPLKSQIYRYHKAIHAPNLLASRWYLQKHEIVKNRDIIDISETGSYLFDDKTTIESTPQTTSIKVDDIENKKLEYIDEQGNLIEKYLITVHFKVMHPVVGFPSQDFNVTSIQDGQLSGASGQYITFLNENYLRTIYSEYNSFGDFIAIHYYTFAVMPTE